jgi:hypothetical protein
VGRQLIAMGTRMGIMPGRQYWFGLQVMGCVRIGAVHGMVMFLLIVTFLVLAGRRPAVGLRITLVILMVLPGFFITKKEELFFC